MHLEQGVHFYRTGDCQIQELYCEGLKSALPQERKTLQRSVLCRNTFWVNVLGET